MAVNISQAMHRTSANPIDDTMTLTKAQMLAVNDNLMPDYYFTICQDDGALYIYDKSATASASTGKFSKYRGDSTGGGHAIVDGAGTTLTQRDYLKFVGVNATDDDVNETTVVEVPQMTSEELQEVKESFSSIIHSAPLRMMNYSTEEQVVGAWIDNKTLYQKTVTATKTNGTNEYSIPLNIGENAFTCYSHHGFFIRSTDKAYFPLPGLGVASGKTNGAGAQFVVYPAQDKVLTRFASDWTAIAGVIYVTIQYTKTTD